MRIRITGWRGTGDVPLSINGVLRRLALGVEHVVSEAEHEVLKAAECVVEVVEDAAESVKELVTGPEQGAAETETTETAGEGDAQTETADAAQPSEAQPTEGSHASEGDASLAASAV